MAVCTVSSCAVLDPVRGTWAPLRADYTASSNFERNLAFLTDINMSTSGSGSSSTGRALLLAGLSFSAGAGACYLYLAITRASSLTRGRITPSPGLENGLVGAPPAQQPSPGGSVRRFQVRVRVYKLVLLCCKRVCCYPIGVLVCAHATTACKRTSMCACAGGPMHAPMRVQAARSAPTQGWPARSLQEDEVITEQLTRNIQFFGLERQQRVADAFVIVVGLGVRRGRALASLLLQTPKMLIGA